MNKNETLINDLIVRAMKGPNNYNAAGTPLHKATKIINGHYVEARITGWGQADRDTVIWLDRSSEPLSISEAVRRLDS